MTVLRITHDDNDRLDEFVAKGVNFHFEVMDDCSFWMQIDDPETGRSWHINCGSVSGRAKGYCNLEDNNWPPLPPLEVES